MKSRAQLNRLLVLLMALLLSLQISVVPAFADGDMPTDAFGEPTGDENVDPSILVDNPIDFVLSGEPFADVLLDAAWHDDICDLYNAGIFFGVADGQFAPYQTITARQVLVTYARMMGLDSSDSNLLVQNAIASRMLSMPAFVNPDAALSREEAIVLLFKCLGAIPSVEPDWSVNLDLESDVYDDPIYSTRYAFQFIVNVTGDLSLFSLTSTEPESAMTRGDYAVLLNSCRKLLSVNSDSVITHLGFDYLPVDVTENFKSELPFLWAHVINIPIEVLRVYRVSGYKILLDDAHIQEYLAKNMSKVTNVVGLFSTGDRCIYAKKGFAIVHEMGHFAHAFMAGHDDIEPIYNAERKMAADLLGAYSSSTFKEYFAECFAFFVKNRDDVMQMNLMQVLVPETYNYFVSLANNGYLRPGNTEPISNNFM